MNKTITILCAGILLFSCESTPVQEKGNKEENHKEANPKETITPIQEVEGYTHFGEEAVDMEKAVSVEDFSTAFMNQEKMDFTLKADLVNVCKKAGCFVEVQLPDSTNMRVMFKGHFTIPTDTKFGTEAIFTGIASLDTTSVKDLRHYVEDKMEGENVSEDQKAELKMEYDAITEPKIEPVFKATGILVKN